MNDKKSFLLIGNGGGGGGSQVQADWNQSDNTQPDYIKNKPTVYNEWFGTQAEYDLIDPKDPNVIYHIEGSEAVDWDDVENKPTFASVATSGDYTDLSNTPTIPSNTSDLNNDSGFITINDVPAQVNADWNESNSASPAYIANKPSTETLTFTLANNTTVTIEVYVKPQPVYNYFYVEDASGNGSTLTIEQADGQLGPQIEVFKSSDQVNWTSMGTTDPNTPLTASVPANGKVYLKATASQWADNTGHRNQLNCDEDFNIGGNIMSLLAGDNYEGATLDTNYTHQFYWMMNQSNVVDASNLVLPSNVTADCYNGMFWHCASMTKAPELPAQTLADRCYFWMFDTCQSLDGLTVYADDNSASDCTNNWLYDAAISADFYNLGQATYTLNDPSGVPTGWTYHTLL